MDEFSIKSKVGACRSSEKLAGWLPMLSEVCGVSIGPESLVGINEAEEIRRSFFSVVKNSSSVIRLYWGSECGACVVRYLNDIKQECSDRQIILFGGNGDCCGAVRILLFSVLRHPFDVWSIVGGDFCLSESDISSGLCLERNFYDGQGKYVKSGVFELTAWGEFARCGPF